MKAILSRAVAAAFLAGSFASPVLAHGDDAPIIRSSVKVTVYDGVTDDLLSAGLNQAGLVSPSAPGFVDPLKPTALELRRRAIHSNYRGIVDTCVVGVLNCLPGGGMGVLWGPGSPGSPTFAAPVVPGLIPGTEYKAYLRLPDHNPHINNVPAAVQIPRHFDPKKPCIVAALPSGSRSLYGGIAIAEWALFKGCAVALPGKGTDTGFHLLDAVPYAVDDLDGVAGAPAALGHRAQFALRDSRKLEAYATANPHRIAVKHAHSQINPERLWGEFALQGIEFAFWALNDHFRGKQHFSRKNTLVIAAGASNGGGMALRALEADDKGLIDGLVVTEPNVGPRDGNFTIKFGDDAPFDPKGRTIYDSITLFSVYAACAAHATGASGAIVGPQAGGIERCTSLKEKGLISGTTLVEQANSARDKLRAHGYAEAQDWGIASHDTLNLWRALQVTYANAYGRFAVEDNLCGMSFAATDLLTGRPAAISEANAEKLFADSSGVPPTGGVNLVADQAVNGPILEALAVSRSTGRNDLNIDAALCFRALQTGEGIDNAEEFFNFARVRFGTREVGTTGKLHGKPAIVIHGRRDALVFPNLHSRAYYALNQQEERRNSRLSYVEVTTGQHFDAFISSIFAGATGAQFVPLHYYFVQAMDSMYAHLTKGSDLPPSQVVRPKPRGTTPYTDETLAADPQLLPPMRRNPAASDRITFERGVLTIPE